MKKLKLLIEAQEKVNFEALETYFILLGLEQYKIKPQTYFDNIITDALFEGEKLIKAISEANQIYIDSALIGDSNMLFKNMMYYAEKLKWKKKELFIFRDISKFHNIFEQNSNRETYLFRNCFKNNTLNMLKTIDNFTSWEAIRTE